MANDKTELFPTVVVLEGIAAPALGEADVDGNYFANSGRCFIRAKNSSATLKRTVTITSQVKCNYEETHHVAEELAAGAEFLIGPFPKGRFNDEDGNVQITYSGEAEFLIADITIVVIEVP